MTDHLTQYGYTLHLIENVLTNHTPVWNIKNDNFTCQADGCGWIAPKNTNVEESYAYHAGLHIAIDIDNATHITASGHPDIRERPRDELYWTVRRTLETIIKNHTLWRHGGYHYSCGKSCTWKETYQEDTYPGTIGVHHTHNQHVAETICLELIKLIKT